MTQAETREFFKEIKRRVDAVAEPYAIPGPTYKCPECEIDCQIRFGRHSNGFTMWHNGHCLLRPPRYCYIFYPTKEEAIEAFFKELEN